MDLVGESAATALDFVVDGELATNATSTSPRGVINVSDGSGNFEANGTCLNGVHGSETSGNVGGVMPLGRNQVGGSSNSSPTLSKSPSVSSPPVKKGYGLKKWRRIRRDVVKDTSGGVDGGKALKRGLSGAGSSVRPVNRGSVESKQASEVFVGSASVLTSPGFVDENGIPGSSLDSRFAVGSAFTTGAESENSVSEDRSSKSSTAASAPRARNDPGGGSGNRWEKNRTKSNPVKVAGSSAQRGQQGKWPAESSKKPRGERAKIEKQNSHSSLESDSRSSNFVFSQGPYSVNSNGKQGEMSMNDDGENSDEAHAGEELQTRYDRETAEEVGYVSLDGSAVDASSQNKEDKSENNHSSTEKDPLVESLTMLEYMQEVLETEVKLFKEIGKVSCHTDTPHADPEDASSEFEQSEAKDVEQLSMLSQRVKDLESRLKEVLMVVCSKEAQVAELEDKLQQNKSDNKDVETDFKTRSEEMEIEFELLFKQKIEAEVQTQALRKTVQESNANESDPQPLRTEIKALIGEQVQMQEKVRQVENKAEALKISAEGQEKYSGKLLDAEEEASNIEKGICKAASCFSIQLMLLILVFWFLVLQMSPQSGVVPT